LLLHKKKKTVSQHAEKEKKKKIHSLATAFLLHCCSAQVVAQGRSLKGQLARVSCT
jgi:hypothetical protein